MGLIGHSNWSLLFFLGNQFFGGLPTPSPCLLQQLVSSGEWEVGWGLKKGQKVYNISLSIYIYKEEWFILFCLFLFVTFISPPSHDISQ